MILFIVKCSQVCIFRIQQWYTTLIRLLPGAVLPPSALHCGGSCWRRQSNAFDSPRSSFLLVSTTNQTTPNTAEMANSEGKRNLLCSPLDNAIRILIMKFRRFVDSVCLIICHYTALQMVCWLHFIYYEGLVAARPVQTAELSTSFNFRRLDKIT